MALLTVFCSSVPAAPPAGKVEPAAWHTIVAFGDSITCGYGVPAGAGWVELLPGLLNQSTSQTVAVFNAGGNGNTSAEGLKRIKKDVLAHMPGLVLVEFGMTGVGMTGVNP